MFDVITKSLGSVAETLNPITLIDRTYKAFSRAKEKSKNAAGAERLMLGAKLFFEEWKALGAEKEKLSKETEEAVKAPISEVMKEGKAAFGADEEKMSKEEKESYNKVLATFLSEGKQREGYGHFLQAAGKFEKTARGEESEPLTMKEALSGGAVMISGILELAKGRKREEFIKLMEDFQSATKDSNLPFDKLFSAEAMNLFALEVDILELSKIAGGFEIGTDDFPKIVGSFSKISSPDLSEKDLKEAAEAMKPVFKNSSVEARMKVLKVINKMIGESSDTLAVEDIADLAYSGLDQRDWDVLIDLLAGERKAPKKVA